MKPIVMAISFLFIASIATCAQGTHFRGYEMDWTSGQLLPVFYDQLRGAVTCGSFQSAGAKLRMALERGQLESSPEFVAESDSDGKFRIGGVLSNGYWNLEVVALCDGKEHRTRQLVRVVPDGFGADCMERELIVDAKEEKTRLRLRDMSLYVNATWVCADCCDLYRKRC